MKISVWGPETWLLLHTIPEKIYDDRYTECKNDIFQIISLISSSVPCPFCREHAIQYLRRHNIRLCNTKETLKMYIFNFHNDVNTKLRKNTFPYSSLSKYSVVNFSLLVRQYSTNNSKNRTSDLGFSFHRNNNIRTINKLFIRNTYAFSP